MRISRNLRSAYWGVMLLVATIVAIVAAAFFGLGAWLF